MCYKYLPCQNLSHDFDEKSDFLNYELMNLRVGSREHVTSFNQDIKANVGTLVWRRGVRGSCFILRRVFLSTLALKKDYAV